jgi:iduronate 2-sulfatase
MTSQDRTRNRREFLLTALAAPSIASAAAPRPNVIFLVADDLNTALGCYGNSIVKTPNIDRLAARSVLFNRAYCQFPLCAPSRASFLSGRRPAGTGVWTLQIPTRKYLDDAVFLPELFRNAGYFTADFGKIFHDGPIHADPRSWDLLDAGARDRDTWRSEIIDGHAMPRPRNHTMEWARLKTTDDTLSDAHSTRKAVEFIQRSAQQAKPFFLALGLRMPHSPYAAPSRYFDLYNAERIPAPEVPEEHIRLLPAAAWYELADQVRPDRDQAKKYIAAYYACVSFMDAQVGRVLAAMDEGDHWQNTVVVFLSDNGYHLGEHGMWHKMTLFEESARIPLLISAPGMAKGKRCGGLVELVDLYPTLAQLAGLRTRSKLDGSSLVPQLRNPAAPAREAAYTSVNRHEDRSRMTSAFTYFGHSLRTARWRYTEWDGGSRGVELYDEKNDPGELRNLASEPKYEKQKSELQRLLRRHAFDAGHIPRASR